MKPGTCTAAGCLPLVLMFSMNLLTGLQPNSTFTHTVANNAVFDQEFKRTEHKDAGKMLSFERSDNCYSTIIVQQSTMEDCIINDT